MHAKEELLHIVEALPQIVLVLRDSEVIFANATAVAALKHAAASSLVGRRMLELVAEENRLLLGAMITTSTDRTRAPSTLVAGDGSHVHVEVALARTIDFQGAPAGLFVLTDVTARLQLESHVRLTDRMASLGAMAAGIAHELNNPLAYVMANLEYASEQVEAPDTARLELPELRAALDDARDGAKRMTRIVAALKTFSRVDEDERTPLSVNDLLESAIDLAWGQIRHRAQVVRAMDDVPKVVANEGRLVQVFVNLLINAAQAIPEGNRGTITVKTSRARAGGIAIEITDTGCGIPSHVLPRIFEPFYTTKPRGVGTGLGLSICHGIVKALGGSMDVRTEVGSGTTFSVHLPLGVARTLPPPSAPSSSVVPYGGRVLVVDDETAVGSVVRRILSAYDVSHASSVSEAMERLRRGEMFDVVLCDLMMPTMNGDVLYEAMQRMRPAIAKRFVFVTGGATSPRLREFLEHIPTPRLVKPFTADDLRRTVSDVITATASGDDFDDESGVRSLPGARNAIRSCSSE